MQATITVDVSDGGVTQALMKFNTSTVSVISSQLSKSFLCLAQAARSQPTACCSHWTKLPRGTASAAAVSS